MAARVVDYSPLLSTPTPHEVAEYRARARAEGAAWSKTSVTGIIAGILFAIVSAIVVIPVLGGILLFATEGLRSGSPLAVVFLLLFVLGIGVVGFAIVRVVIAARGTWGRRLRMDRFARANGFAYSPVDGDPDYPGAIFGLGHTREVLDCFRTVEGRFVDFGNYRYVTGAGKSRATHDWGYLALRLDRKLPHMVLDSRTNNGMFGASNLPIRFADDQILSLEGDFDDYFRLYCPAEYERDALYVFTPDLMALLIDTASPFDVEIIDDWLFVYSSKPFPPADPAVYRRLLDIVATVGAKTLSQTDRYHDERAAAPFEADVVAPQGTRLKRGVSAVAVVMIVVAGLIWGWSFFSDVLGG